MHVPKPNVIVPQFCTLHCPAKQLIHSPNSKCEMSSTLFWNQLNLNDQD